MAGNASSTLTFQVTNTTGDREVTTLMEWTYMRAKLAANAGGVANQLIFGSGSTGFLFDPGETNDFVVAPGTRIEVRTDGALSANWSFSFTPLLPVNQLLNLTGVMVQLLQILACSVAPGTQIAMTDEPTARTARGRAPGAIGGAYVVTSGARIAGGEER